MDEVKDIRQNASLLGPNWQAIYSSPTECQSVHFTTAMTNIILHPNVNSTVLMRADILRRIDHKENTDPELQVPPIDKETMPLLKNIDDIEPRYVDVSSNFGTIDTSIVRRMIPRNPRRDPVINQSCIIYKGESGDSGQNIAVVYIAHINSPDESPYYLPPVKAIAIVYSGTQISVHYVPFSEKVTFSELDDTDRNLRIARRLLQTSNKHSTGVMAGYKKRVNHDMVVDKVAFQDRYIHLKQKYANDLVAGWVESTDPRKHVFEDLAIASFLIELWKQMYGSKDFKFVDVGCGNGLLVHILIQEGYKGFGIDARARKSWAEYPQETRTNLREQIIVPQILLKHPELCTEVVDHPEIQHDDKINFLDLPDDTFVIGNHSDELTVWIPLLGYPFMVIPCCSHSLSGAKMRFASKCPENKSKYAGLVDHVVDISTSIGWNVETESLRIPSTRNAAIIGRYKQEGWPLKDIVSVVQSEGGADGWVSRSVALKASAPRSH